MIYLQGIKWDTLSLFNKHIIMYIKGQCGKTKTHERFLEKFWEFCIATFILKIIFIVFKSVFNLWIVVFILNVILTNFRKIIYT